MKNSNCLALIVLFIFLFSCINQSNGNKEKPQLIQNITNKDSCSKQQLISLCNEFNILNTLIRDEKIPKKIAKQKFRNKIDSISLFYFKDSSTQHEENEDIFPLKGYNSSVIGGSDGSGYISSGFNYFDGNNRQGHPAHDIFIYDINQDCIEDKTKKPAPVLSMTDGIVISLEEQWETTSSLKGGKYIYIYCPLKQQIYYYAHNDKLLVKIGEIIKAGTVIATVGRTGFSAFQKRSPTHLHIMGLQLDSTSCPYPINIYLELKKCKTI